MLLTKKTSDALTKALRVDHDHYFETAFRRLSTAVVKVYINSTNVVLVINLIDAEDDDLVDCLILDRDLPVGGSYKKDDFESSVEEMLYMAEHWIAFELELSKDLVNIDRKFDGKITQTVGNYL